MTSTARRVLAMAAVSAATLALSSCVDSRMEPPPPSVKVTAQDVYGTWRGWEGSSLTLRPEAEASTVKLDGQEFDFDDAWRMTGTGTWRLQRPGTYRGGNTVGDGSVIHLEVNTADGAEGSRTSAGTTSQAPLASGTPNARVAASRTEPPPARSTWDLGVTKGKQGELLLFFLTSDPDVRDTYYLTKDGTESS
ncbi:hypothetical protein OG252_35625 [Streptomyces sp. NBC_01352]|uniref:Lipoprotein n=1 Tax=Streptomyces plumbiresistens TaxID=511811 RepID=A0ABP7RFI5_9ACTN|nr:MULTISPECIES: hypothetical protein [unclassified Streptomyces]MCX4701274.1 hypothetical protein [Streptomyces sp. NBC_01373]